LLKSIYKCKSYTSCDMIQVRPWACSCSVARSTVGEERSPGFGPAFVPVPFLASCAPPAAPSSLSFQSPSSPIVSSASVRRHGYKYSACISKAHCSLWLPASSSLPSRPDATSWPPPPPQQQQQSPPRRPPAPGPPPPPAAGSSRLVEAPPAPRSRCGPAAGSLVRAPL
jgi:hypothetical protein